MARPIKEIPILEGSDARNFYTAIKNNKKITVPRKDYERAITAYKSIKLKG